MKNPLDDFMQRTAYEGINYYTLEMDVDTANDIDAWGNEWETENDDDVMD